jgi:RNA polymerase sigma factor (sigma-70 family)
MSIGSPNRSGEIHQRFSTVPRLRRDRLIEEHVTLVEYIAGAFSRKTKGVIDRDDLIGDGMEALVKASRSWDPERGPFDKHASAKVKYAMVDAMRRTFGRPDRCTTPRKPPLSLDLPAHSPDASAMTIGDTLVDGTADVQAQAEARAQLARAVNMRKAGLNPTEKPTAWELQHVISGTWRGSVNLLTAAEWEALAGAALGETMQETASRLRKGVETVRSQRKSVIKKLGARDMTNAVFLAVACGLLDLPDAA